jgi:acetyltransferase
VVGDQYQRSGLGTALVRRVLEVARDEKLNRVIAGILPENVPMQELCRKMGFRLNYSLEEQVVRAELSTS